MKNIKMLIGEEIYSELCGSGNEGIFSEEELQKLKRTRSKRALKVFLKRRFKTYINLNKTSIDIAKQPPKASRKIDDRFFIIEFFFRFLEMLFYL
ncbi:MAG: hypothetical protein ACYTFY_06870 [Planctomycetota bacterium]|jgi:hypothetical protein